MGWQKEWMLSRRGVRFVPGGDSRPGVLASGVASQNPSINFSLARRKRERAGVRAICPAPSSYGIPYKSELYKKCYR